MRADHLRESDDGDGDIAADTDVFEEAIFHRRHHLITERLGALQATSKANVASQPKRSKTTPRPPPSCSDDLLHLVCVLFFQHVDERGGRCERSGGRGAADLQHARIGVLVSDQNVHQLKTRARKQKGWQRREERGTAERKSSPAIRRTLPSTAVAR